MNFEQILAYLQADGWPIERLGTNTARSRFKGRARSFPFFVHTDATYLTLLCVPYARLPAEELRAKALMDRLLHLNRELNMAKFAVDDDGDVVLAVDYPLADLDNSEVRDALDVMSFYADKHWEEVSALAAG
ncbi:MAG: YbjN domain-containing protein [Deltaproteobacteria bacterium]|nr:YbjN domain-containing protein [Deltaproteobacteria bacterium]